MLFNLENNLVTTLLDYHNPLLSCKSYPYIHRSVYYLSTERLHFVVDETFIVHHNWISFTDQDIIPKRYIYITDIPYLFL